MAVGTIHELRWDAGGMDLAQTLFCGQSFSWQPAAGEAGVWAGCAGPHALLARQQSNWLHVRRPDGKPLAPGETVYWRRYFALDEDYAGLLAKFGKNKALAACVACAPGLRVLRQPFFDTLLAFLISQNNHIPRITAIAQRLRQGFGPNLGGGVFGFPPPEVLAGAPVSALAELGAGYRAKYLVHAGAMVAGGQVTQAALDLLPDAEARELLCTIAGVGPKVADCVLLFGLGRRNIAPMDVWMKRAMKTLFPRGMPAAAKGNEGIAQQYIFCWARQNLQRGS